MANDTAMVEGEFKRLAANYKTISGMNLNALPSRMANRGYQLRERMAQGIRRIQRTSGVADSANENRNLGFWPVLIGTGAVSGLTWLATKLGDESDGYLAQTEVVQQLIESGVTPEKAADIVLGKNRMQTWKAVGIGAGIGFVTLLGVQFWLKRKKA